MILSADNVGVYSIFDIISKTSESIFVNGYVPFSSIDSLFYFSKEVIA